MAQTNGHGNLKFWGWRRENGRVGVRNHVVILPLDDLSNAACEAVANTIKGKGVSLLEAGPDKWHGKPIPPDEEAKALAEIGASL